MNVYTTLPTDDLNLAVEVTESNDMVTLNITPASVNVTSAVTSVNGLTGNVTLTTTEISEGTNLYYTDARADARVDLQTGANLDLSFMDTDDLAEGPTKLYYTDGRVQTVINTNSAGFITSSALVPYSTTAQVTALPVSTFTNDAGYSTTTGTVTPTSTDTFTNKSGSNLQWTNDAGYITSETDSQTLSFADPVLTISGSLSTVDLSALNTTTLAWSAITATPTTIAGYGITDAFSGAYADLSGKPTIPTNNNQLTNGAGYTTNTGTVTPTSTDTFTNKSGAISQWTNDSGYLTAETDSQTLSFTSPNLTISNGNFQNLSSLEIATIDGGTY